MSDFILGAIIAVIIYILFFDQCSALDRYGFQVLKDSSASFQAFTTKVTSGFTKAVKTGR
jgi:hypothetical protein